MIRVFAIDINCDEFYITYTFCFRWVQTGTLQASSHISSLSWNLEGTRLLTGGVKIQMWHEKISKEEEPTGKNTIRL